MCTRMSRSVVITAVWLTVAAVTPSALGQAARTTPASESRVPNDSPVAQTVEMPELLAPLEPEYPSHATGNARVILHLTLDASGLVTDVSVIEGNEPFASAAVRAARKGRFTPARRAGVALAAKITVAVDFTYAQQEEPAPEPAESPVQSQDARRASAPDATDETAAAAEPVSIDIVVQAPRVDETERQINKAEARLMAGTFGDPLRAVELLPGITPLISGVPYFFVRGAPAGSVNFYVDDAKVPQLYHVGPGSSVLHPQFVDGVALRSGPYRARYGDATSGVVTTRVVTDIAEPAVEVEAKVFESSAYVGGPIASGRGSAAVAGKVSHLGPVLALVTPEIKLDYWDYQGLVSYDLSPRDQFTVFAFGASDFVGEEEFGEVDVNIDTQFHRLKLGYNRNIQSGIDLSNYVIVGMEGTRFDAEDEHLQDQSIGAGSILSYVVDDTWEWATGASIDVTKVDASGAPAFFGEPHNAAVSRTDSNVALWGEGRVSPTRQVSLDAGVRVAGYQSKAETAVAVEPRLTSTLRFGERLTSILAVGYSTQTPTAAVPAPAVRPAELIGGLQKSLQRALTLRYSVPLVFTVEGTGFYNEYQTLSDPLSLTTVPDPLEVGDASNGGEPPTEDLNFSDKPNGRSYGLELMLRRPFTNKLSGTLAYTLSRSTRRVGGQDVPSSFDRTHILNTTLGYDLGKGYNISTRFLLYSGLPVRQIGVPGGRTGDRSDAFARLDLRFSKEWNLSWGDLMFIVEMLNATFQEEILGVSCTQVGCATATFGPISVPSVGLRGTFGGARADDPNRANYQ